MVDFETLEGTEVTFGGNDFIQVARKKAVDEDSENVFLSLSKGFFGDNDERIWQKNFSIPDDEEVLDEIIEALKKLRK
ncbi:MAG: hypothetical protein ACLFTQ_01945 [Candidatus Aenigmatarchaeota archaeon]